MIESLLHCFQDLSHGGEASYHRETCGTGNALWYAGQVICSISQAFRSWPVCFILQVLANPAVYTHKIVVLVHAVLMHIKLLINCSLCLFGLCLEVAHWLACFLATNCGTVRFEHEALVVTGYGCEAQVKYPQLRILTSMHWRWWGEAQDVIVCLPTQRNAP